MKSIYKLLVVAAILFTGCKKYHEEAFNFSPSLPPYLALKSHAPQSVAQGDTLSFPVLVRTALQEPVTINYQITGDFTLNGTYTLPANTLEGVAEIIIPAGTVPVGAAGAHGTLSLVSASRSGGGITIGRISPDTEKFTVEVTP